MEKNVFIIYSGTFYNEAHFDSVWDQKKDAVLAIKKTGAKYNKEQNLYLQHKNLTHYRIEKIKSNELFRTW